MSKGVTIAAVVLAGMAYWHYAMPPSGRRSTLPFVWDQAKVAGLTADLSDADGHPSPPQTLRDAKRILVYFSASWCPPCRAFTPDLVTYYRSHQGGTAFQLLFVSSDQSAGAMYDYMHNDAMPWWGVAYHSVSAKSLVSSYAGPGIPCLVLLDGQGHVLADSFVDGRYVGPREVLKALDAGH